MELQGQVKAEQQQEGALPWLSEALRKTKH